MELTTEQKLRVLELYGISSEVDTLDGSGSILGLHPKAVKVHLNTVGYNQEMKGRRVEEMHYMYFFYQVKLILRTIEQLTDEEQAVIAAMYGGVRIKIDDDGFLQIIDKEGMVPKWFILSQDLPSMLSQYLISIGVCVPLFIAPNHPSNGQDAIRLGLAIQQS